MNPKHPTHTAPSRVRYGRVAAFLAVITLLAAAAWLVGHAIPQPASFTTRRGSIVAATEGQEVLLPHNQLTKAVRLTTSTGLTVDLRVLRPAGPPIPLPLVVLLAGHRTGRDAVDVVGNPGGIAVAAVDYPYHGPERPRGIVQSLNAIPAIQRGLLDTPPAVSVALDWLLTEPWVDPSKVELMGVSLGVPFAAVAGALDSRFRRVWLVHGGVDNRAWLANRLESRIENNATRQAAASLLHLLAHGESFRPERWIPKIAPRTVMVVGADDDEQMPRASVEKLYAVAREPKELLWSNGGHVDTHRPEIIHQILALARNRIEETVELPGRMN